MQLQALSHALCWSRSVASAWEAIVGSQQHQTSLPVPILIVCFLVPVDSAVFLEFLPGTHQYLLEILAVWWSFGQFIPAGAAWGFLPRYSCSADTPVGQCKKADNMGWRYLMYSMGAITLAAFFARFVFFKLRESPRYLIGQGRYQEAIDVLNDVAKYNGTTQPLTVEDLIQVERDFA